MIDEIKHFDMRIFLAFERVVHRVGTSFKVHLADSDTDLFDRYILNGESAKELEAYCRELKS